MCLQCSECLLDLIRVACYAHQMDEAIRLANLCVERGYEVSINLMGENNAIPTSWTSMDFQGRL